MCKLFNNQIIQILCNKHREKVWNNEMDPMVNRRPPQMRNGESYVVFLDRQHRRELQQQIDATEQLLQTQRNGGMGDAVAAPPVEYAQPVLADGGNNWLRTQIYTRKMKDELKACLSKSILSMANLVKRSISGWELFSTAVPVGNYETVRSTPVIIGAFIDEPICASIDQLLYAICYMFGWRFELKELPPLDDQ